MGRHLLRRTITVLPVDDIAQATGWYEAALGFETVYLHEGADEDEVTNYAIVVRDGVAVHLILDEAPPYPDRQPWTLAGTGYLYLIVRDVDAAYEEFTAKDVVPTRELRIESWGARAFNLADPSGNTIHIEQGT